VGKTDAYGNTALLLAAEKGHLHLTQLLIGKLLILTQFAGIFLRKKSFAISCGDPDPVGSGPFLSDPDVCFNVGAVMIHTAPPFPEKVAEIG
jgi:ankyrin repeat protein